MKKFMKNSLTGIAILTSMMILEITEAQVPQSINYQAVIRTGAGTVMVNQNVSLRIYLHDSSPSGPVEYAEQHNSVTNAYGLVNVKIGQGTPILGAFSGITWPTGN